VAAWDGSYKMGINFRQTTAYATNPANTGLHHNGDSLGDLQGSNTVTLASTGDTVSVGWTTSGGTPGADLGGGQNNNRDSGVDARLAGNTHIDANTVRDLVITLPSAGNYYFWCAFGDNGYSRAAQWEILDSASSLDTISLAATGGAARWWDATETLRTSAANWVTAHDNGTTAAVLYTFATTTMRIRVGTGANGDVVPLAHVGLLKAAASSTIVNRESTRRGSGRGVLRGV
jgi:hypothetical protein